MTHPEMARMLINERQRDLLRQAETSRVRRFARKQRKAQEARAHAVAVVPVPRIPDFVDGTFREDAETVPAARTAA
jgi:hypothetical protein